MKAFLGDMDAVIRMLESRRGSCSLNELLRIYEIVGHTLRIDAMGQT